MKYVKSIVLYIVIVNETCKTAVLISDYQMNRMIELFALEPFCKLYTDRGIIRKKIFAADSKKVRYDTTINVKQLDAACLEWQQHNGQLQGGLGFIYPGTKWCGPGSLAKGYGELGRYSEEDQCCRDHDYCPNILLPGQCKRGLCNKQAFTRSHCDCDAKLRKCLHRLNTDTANTLGAVFFNIIQVTCFTERRPCTVYQRAGYNITQIEELCSRLKFRPSEKYTSSIQYKIHN